MNIFRKIVKEIVLVPYRVAQGVGDAVEEVVTPKEEKKK